MKGVISNRTFKIVNTILWIFAIIGMVAMVYAYIELKEGHRMIANLVVEHLNKLDNGNK